MSLNQKHSGISQSAISLYRRCPYAYFLKYRKRCIPMFYSMDAMDTGRHVHEALDKYYTFHYDNNATVDYILANTYNELTKVWEVELGPENLKKAYQCLEHHAEWEFNNIKSGLITKPLSEIKAAYGGYFGYIDYLNLDSMKAIDWKTGKHANLSYEYRMQAYVYKILLEGKFGIELSHFYFYFPHPDEWRTVRFDTEKQIQVGKDVENYKRDILKGLFPKKPRTPSVCTGCEYGHYCQLLKV